MIVLVKLWLKRHLKAMKCRNITSLSEYCLATFPSYPTESWWQLLPLKFGRILASYPETLPISLSRNSDGGIGEAAFLAAASLDAAKLEDRKVKQVRGEAEVQTVKKRNNHSLNEMKSRFISREIWQCCWKNCCNYVSC